MMNKLKIAAVSYLNARPLIAGLEDCPNIELVRDVPSSLMQMLHNGCADVALVPVIDVLRSDRKLFFDNHYCIACRDAAMTVKIFSPKPIDQINALAVDSESHSSVALAKILISKHTGTVPTVRPVKIDDPSRGLDEPTLLIGDKTVHAGDADYVYDLGQLWHQETQLSFVFAVWAMVDQKTADEFRDIVYPQIQQNLCRLDQLAERYGPQHGFTAERARTYLKDIMCYQFDDSATNGMHRFASEAAQLGLCRYSGSLEDQYTQQQFQQIISHVDQQNQH